jgi:hypothetical protein
MPIDISKYIIVGGHPLKDENGNLIGHRTAWGEDIYFTKETRDAISEHKTTEVDVEEQTETSTEVDETVRQ